MIPKILEIQSFCSPAMKCTQMCTLWQYYIIKFFLIIFIYPNGISIVYLGPILCEKSRLGGHGHKVTRCPYRHNHRLWFIVLEPRTPRLGLLAHKQSVRLFDLRKSGRNIVRVMYSERVVGKMVKLKGNFLSKTDYLPCIK